MNSKRRIIITSTISILLVSILLIGSTYSVFTSQDIEEDINVFQTGTLGVTYTVSSDNVALNNSMPMNNEDSASIKPYRITVKNTGNVPFMFNVILIDTTAKEAIDAQYLYSKVGKLEEKSLDSCNTTTFKEDDTTYNGRILKEGIIISPSETGNEEVNIDIRIWIADIVKNTEITKSFYGKLAIDGEAIYDYNTKMDHTILENPFLSAEEFSYDHSKTGVNCSNVQCMIDELAS